MGIDVTIALLGIACVLLVAQWGWLWRLSRVAGALQRYEERLNHVSDALALLTEATESGFRAVATEVERIVETGPARARKPVNVARLTAAAKRGRSPADIAAGEGLSEGEVALRLHLAEVAGPRAAAGRRSRVPSENADGTVRPQ